MNNDFMDTARFAYGPNKIGIQSGVEYTHDETGVRIQNNSNNDIWIDPEDLKEGEVIVYPEEKKSASDSIKHVYKALGQVPSKSRVELKKSLERMSRGVVASLVMPKGFVEQAKKREENEMKKKYLQPKATEIWLGQYRIEPTTFKAVGEYNGSVKCFKLEFVKIYGFIFHVGDNPPLKVHYSDGSEKMFKEGNVIEIIDEKREGVYYQGLVLKCIDEINLPDPDTTLPWEKIEKPKKPNLFVIQDWKMDLTKCRVDIKTSRDRGANSLVSISFYIELKENDDFGVIKGQPILYFEYPEGKFTFECIKITVEKITPTIEGKKFVPYEFTAKLIKEILT